jgi:putative endonuclease
MPWFVYIIQSEMDGTYYKGSSQDPYKRLLQHNAGESNYTSSKIPWKLVYLEELDSKKEMLIRERKLKRGNADYFFQLIQGDKNLLNKER